MSLQRINTTEWTIIPTAGARGWLWRLSRSTVHANRWSKKIGRPVRTVYLTPQGRVLNQTIVEELAMEEELILLCGHYEGIDERVLEDVVTDYISIGGLCADRR